MGTQNKLKILYILPSLNVGGRERLLIELINHLNKNRFLPIVCCLRKGGILTESLRNSGVEIISLGKKNGIDLGLFLRLTSTFRKHRPQIVHVHNPGGLLYGCVAAKLARVPVIINTEHGYNSTIRPSKFLIETIARNHINKTIAVSNNLYHTLSEKKWAVGEKYITISNGIDVTKYNTSSNKIVQRRYLGLSENEKVIGIIARLEEVKDHKTLLTAFKIIANQTNNTRLLIVGDGPLHKDLVAYASRLGLNGRVDFWGYRDDIPEILSSLDIFVLSSNFEGMSITILEAMAAGKPVIATAVGGNPEIINNKITGLLVPPRNPELLANAMLDLLQNEVKSIQMGEKAKNIIEQQFNIKDITRKTEELYESFIKSFNQVRIKNEL